MEAPPGDSEEVRAADRIRRRGEMARMIARRRRRWRRRHEPRYVIIPEWESPVEGVALSTPDTDDERVGEHCSQCISGASPEEPPSASSVTEPVGTIRDQYITFVMEAFVARLQQGQEAIDDSVLRRNRKPGGAERRSPPVLRAPPAKRARGMPAGAGGAVSSVQDTDNEDARRVVPELYDGMDEMEFQGLATISSERFQGKEGSSNGDAAQRDLTQTERGAVSSVQDTDNEEARRVVPELYDGMDEMEPHRPPSTAHSTVHRHQRDGVQAPSTAPTHNDA